MKAAIYETYGSPDVVRIVDLPRPSPGPHDLLVKVVATTVNRNDCGFRLPEYAWIIRPLHGLFRPRIKVLGTEFSGVVEAVGNRVASVKPGDEIFGLTGNRFGCHAEFLVVPEAGAFAPKPAHLKHEEAVSLLDGPWLAHAVLTSFPTEKTRRLLIYGASGSIGSACVEFALAQGIHVTAVTQSQHLERVKALGAQVTEVVESQAWRHPDSLYDGIIDAVGKLPFLEAQKSLSPTGRWVSTDFGPGNEILWRSLFSLLSRGQKVGLAIPVLKKETIHLIKTMSEKKQLVPLVDSYFPLDRIVEAYRYVERQAKFGSVVIRL